MVKNDLINCIKKVMQKEENYLISKGEELKLNGITVIDLHLPKNQQEFLDIDWLSTV